MGTEKRSRNTEKEKTQELFITWPVRKSSEKNSQEKANGRKS